MKKRFLFSVVMAVYNTEEYVEEAIQSVLNQTIGFKKNIQLIMINDGSTDGSGKICRRYARMYPDNIVYKKTKNRGVSKARNCGLKYATGEWVNFLDSDDKWSKNAFKDVIKYANRHKDIKILAARIRYFDASRAFHMLDFRFKENHTIDINEKCNEIQMHSSSCFFSAECIGDERFDSKMKYAEDSKFATSLIMNESKYAVIKDALYLYRKRKGENKSAMQKLHNDEAYKEMLDNFHGYLVEKYKDNEKRLPRYIQSIILYELSWRMYDIERASDDESRKKIKCLLSYIEDDLIINFFRFKAEKKYGALKIKYGDRIESLTFAEDGIVSVNGEKITNYAKHALEIFSIKRRGDKINVSGRIKTLFPDNLIRLKCEIDGKLSDVRLRETGLGEIKNCFDQKCRYTYLFEVNIPISAKKTSFKMSVLDDSDETVKINFGRFAKLNKYSRSYYWCGDKIIYSSDGCKTLNIVSFSLRRIIAKELKYSLLILKRRHLILPLIRWRTIIGKCFVKKPIWIISDRPNVANDNGFAFYKFLLQNHQGEYDYYFALSSDSKDYKKVTSCGGKVLNFGSRKYKKIFRLSNKIISSQADEYIVRCDTGRKEWWLRDLIDYDYIFLQHGVTLHDLSGWLNKINKNISLFCTETSDEHNSIITGNYCYSANEVKQTGFARHDLLGTKNTKKMIVIMPTWRANLGGHFNRRKKIRDYNDDFVKSDYCLKYNSLINNSKLIASMRRYGYKGLFVVHPSHITNKEDFIGNDIIKIASEDLDYSKAFSQGALLVTDYSSVAFEMAYLRKRILYYQFDKEDFYSEHFTKKGYYDFEKDGFGEICYDEDTIVKAIIESMNNDCKVERKYSKRIESTFRPIDKNNCARIYDEITKI